jgi:TolB-like protein
MSGDPEQEYLADGTVEEIITALSLFKSVRRTKKLWELHKCVVEFHSRCAQFSHFSAALKKNHRQDEERLFLW